MQTIPIFQIDSFASGPFTGNPAAVCLMSEPASDHWLRDVAAEMNLAETAFVWELSERFRLRWFTPLVEVDLCGHATLAAAHALWECGWLAPNEVAKFDSESGELFAQRSGELIQLDFPAEPATECEPPIGFEDALSIDPVWFGKNRIDYLVQVESEAEVENAKVDFKRLAEITDRGLMVTASSHRDDCDFVSRFFAPGVGIPEDPVTGSAHCCLAPFWSERLGKTTLVGFQASKRGGFVQTQMLADRVQLGGRATTILEGALKVPVA